VLNNNHRITLDLSFSEWTL